MQDRRKQDQAGHTRRLIERFAAREGRSLSQASERLIEFGLATLASDVSLVREALPVPTPPAPAKATAPAAGPALAGSLRGGLVPSLDDFRSARSVLSQSLDARSRMRAQPGR